MAKYKYEKFKIGGGKVYILSQHEGESWDGPAITHQCKNKTTSIGTFIDQRKFSFEVNLLSEKGDEYIFKANNKDGYPNGPVIVASNGALYFGPYYAKMGFHGIVYKVKQGEKIHVQQYNHGVLVDECLNDTIIYENVGRLLPFDPWYEIESDELVTRKLDNKKIKAVEYIAGDPLGHQTVLASRVLDSGDIVIGEYKNNAFNGLAFEYKDELKLSTFQTYDNDVPTKDFRLLYLPEAHLFSLIMKDTQIKDGKTEYVSIVYGMQDKECKFGIQYLDKKDTPIGDMAYLPNYIDPNAEKPYGPAIPKHLPKKDKNGLTAKERLNNLIGLDSVKKELNKMEAILKKNPDSPLTLNMCFYGNPGTGKTEVARLLAEVLYDEGLLKENKLVEVDPSGLVAEYVGQTQPKTHAVFKKALNGVLFIDEAYNLASGGFKGEGGSDFGAEAIGALLEDMETYRGQICVILAGYRKPMEDMIATNPGFASRINRKIDFPDYTREELEKIASLMISSMKYSTDNAVISAIAKIVDSRKFLDGYANAREVRLVVEKLTEIQAERTIDEKANRTITMEDVNKYNEKDSPEKEDGLTAEERLQELIGLDSVKSEIEKMVAILEKNKGDLGKTNLHMCFYGNPGTGKTEVANLIANIFYDKGILPTNKIVTTNASGLISGYLGQTAIKTHKAVKDALNGVLFIDEAYALNDGGHGFGKEAVAALLEDMENYRGKFAVILAGYKDEMEDLFSLNPGFDSRINRKIIFPDYTTSELLRVAQLMIDKKKYLIEDDAKTELGKVFLYMKEFAKAYNKPFANAREVRNALESIYEIQALRTIRLGLADDRNIVMEDIKEYEDNHNIDLTSVGKDRKQHHFDINYNMLTALSHGEYFHPDVEYIRRATVNIKVEGPHGAGEGSGFFITDYGIIGTCAHVVAGAEKITVIVSYKTVDDEYITKDYAAEVIAINEDDDTAIIGVLKRNLKVKFYQLKAENKGYPELLTKIVMGGYPLGGSRFADISINQGTVQSVNRDAMDSSKNTWIYVDLSGLPGSSGSGVINAETGQLEGIFAGCSINPGERSQTINRIIPIKYLWKLLAEYCGVTNYNRDTDFIGGYKQSDADDNYAIFNNSNVHKNIILRDEELDTSEVEIIDNRYSNIKIVKGDVTTYNGDAVVNAANRYLAPGAGVCGAVFRSAGYKELEEACRQKGEQAVGSATLTSGFNLNADYIIHAVGPRYDVDRNPERLLKEVYRNVFRVACENGIKSVAFPSISTGIYRFPLDLACPIALREMIDYSSKMDEIVVYCFDDRTYDVYVETLRRLKGYNR